MSIVTYILLNSFISGISGNFHPKQLAQTASTSFVIMVLEIAIMKLGVYLLSISNGNGEGQLLDLLGYSGYKFFGVIMTILIGEVLGQSGILGWSVFLYFFAGNAFFLVWGALLSLLACINATNNSIAPKLEIRSPATRQQPPGKQRGIHFLFHRPQKPKKKEKNMVPVLLQLRLAIPLSAHLNLGRWEGGIK